MAILIFVIGLVLILGSFLSFYSQDKEEEEPRYHTKKMDREQKASGQNRSLSKNVFSGFSLGLGCVLLAIVIGVSNLKTVVDGRTYTEKIEMYQEDNKKIEDQIDAIVQSYLSHEGATFKNTQTEDSLAIITLYPDLKSDTLVKTQIEIYTANNEKLKRLKEEQINVATAKWWLYFDL